MKRMRMLLCLMLCMTMLSGGFTVKTAAEETADASEEEAEVMPEENGEEETPEALTEKSEDTPQEVEEELAEERSEEEEVLSEEEPAQKAERTIMFYVCGSDLETYSAMATHNLNQIVNAKFSAEGKVRVIVLTGGAKTWHFDHAADTAGEPINISSECNQVWQAYGQDYTGNEKFRGKLIWERNGITTSEEQSAKRSADELTSDPETLRAFINYCVDNFPAEKYDLIAWDHGGGPLSGFANDEFKEGSVMGFEQIVDALKTNKVTADGKFDFVDFDTCLLGSSEMALAFADYTDYYIASAELEPGTGQDYKWLTDLGADPKMDTFALGKKIVDYYVSFYEPEGGDVRGSGTLAVIDINKLMKSDFVKTLNAMNTVLSSEVREQRGRADEFLFYDEFGSANQSIKYGGGFGYFDLGNFVMQLGVASQEITLDNFMPGYEIDITNYYTTVVQPLINILASPDIIYARNTSSIHTADKVFHRTAPNGSLNYDILNSSGLFLYFPPQDNSGAAATYVNRLNNVIKLLVPGNAENDGRKEFFEGYRNTVLDYALVTEAGRAVAEIAEEGTAKSLINYDAVKQHWIKNEEWNNLAGKLINYRAGRYDSADVDDSGIREWLGKVITQEAAEAVSNDNVSSYDVNYPLGKGYQITIRQIRKRILDSVFVGLTANIPSADAYLNAHPDIRKAADSEGISGSIEIGTLTGVEETDYGTGLSGDAYLKSYIRWLNETTSVWNVEGASDDWYAVQDPAGNLHAAAVEWFEKTAEVSMVWQNGDQLNRMRLVFDSKADSDGNYRLLKIRFLQDDSASEIAPENLKREFSVTTGKHFESNSKNYCFPISESYFTLNAANASSVRMVCRDAASIPDIKQEGDRKGITRTAYIKDIYGHRYNVSYEVINQPKGTLTSVQLCTSETLYYNGGEQKPVIRYNGETLAEDVDYVFENDTGAAKTSPGTYPITIRGLGNYTNTVNLNFIILPASLKNASVSGIEDELYTGKPIEPKPVVKLDEMILQEGTDYTLSYQNNVNIGTASVTITGKGNFTDSVTEKFEITDERSVPMYRMYNPGSGEHFFTGNAEERDMLVKAGWTNEGVGFRAPVRSDVPVYRLYNPNAGDHHYTSGREERAMLVKAGWKDEGIAFYAEDEKTGMPLYRLYNPNAASGAHHYTTSTDERDMLANTGWIKEGTGFYGLK